MLVLTRKAGEEIWIGENVCVKVIEIDRGKVRLGVKAPRDVPVYRKELLSPADPRVTGTVDKVEQGIADFVRAVAPAAEGGN